VRIYDIEIENKLIIKFIYKDKPFKMVVDLIAKKNKSIIIPSILENNKALAPSSLANVEIIYTVKEGIYQFKSTKFEANIYQGMRVYYVTSQEEVSRLNRREAFRVFIGELSQIDVDAEDGTKKEFEGVLRDISVSGMCIVLKNELDIGTTISIIYNYEGLNIHLLGKITRKDKVERYNAFIYGCKFKETNNGVNRVVVLKQIRGSTKSKG
jgi:c-di-GMP-binding flagellar brake protein YcgR